MTKTYEGFLVMKDYGESDDVLFLSSFDDPLAEDLSWMCNKRVTVRYWVSEKEAPREKIKEDFVKQLCGMADVVFCAHYSEFTGYLWTDEDLNIGGHDLLDELKSHVGKWLLLEVEAEP